MDSDLLRMYLAMVTILGERPFTADEEDDLKRLKRAILDDYVFKRRLLKHLRWSELYGRLLNWADGIAKRLHRWAGRA